MYFNPRTHEECERNIQNQTRNKTSSIHALTRSATKKLIKVSKQLYISIHALTRSATRKETYYIKHTRFQSTHSRGVRLGFTATPILLNYFNPRSHEECDLYFKFLSSMCCDFNPPTHDDSDGK